MTTILRFQPGRQAAAVRKLAGVDPVWALRQLPGIGEVTAQVIAEAAAGQQPET
jgi:hypothetical protein